MSIEIKAISKKHEVMASMTIGYAGFDCLRFRIAPFLGFEYYHKNFTKNHNVLFDKNKPEDDFWNTRYIPEFGDLWIRGTESFDDEDERDKLINFLLQPDTNGQINSETIKLIANRIDSINFADVSAEHQFQQLLHLADEAECKIKWD